MAARRYRLSLRARADLDSISKHLAEHSPGAARRVLTELRHTFLFLAANPNAGTLADSLRQGIRMYSPARPARNYLIFFYLRSDGVEISDVIHAARDWAGMFDREER